MYRRSSQRLKRSAARRVFNFTPNTMKAGSMSISLAETHSRRPQARSSTSQLITIQAATASPTIRRRILWANSRSMAILVRLTALTLKRPQSRRRNTFRWCARLFGVVALSCNIDTILSIISFLLYDSEQWRISGGYNIADCRISMQLTPYRVRAPTGSIAALIVTILRDHS